MIRGLGFRRGSWRTPLLPPAACLLAALAALAAGPGHGAAGRAPEPAGLARFAWLQGCWEARPPGRTIEESWTGARGGAMLGVGRTVRGDTLSDYEFLLLRETPCGLAYEAHPAGQAATTFLARASTDSSIAFTNPDHDFPQEVGYRRIGPDSLLAWLEGAVGGKPRRVEFRFARVRCPGP